MSFTLSQLEIFIQVVSCGSFSAAARKFNKAQSHISTSISNLEIELGVELFNRATKIPTLTAEGRTILEAVESVLKQVRYVEELSNTLTLGIENQVNIMFDDAIPMRILEKTVLAVAEKFPYLKVNIIKPLYNNRVEMISAGEANLAVILSEANYSSDISFRRIGDMPLVNVVGAKHNLAKINITSFAVLYEHRKLIYTPHDGRLLTSEYLQSATAWYFSTYDLILKFLKMGLGWASVPKHLIQNQLEYGEFIILDIAAYPVTQWLVGTDIIWSSKQKLGLAASWIIDYLINMPKPELVNTKLVNTKQKK